MLELADKDIVQEAEKILDSNPSIGTTELARRILELKVKDVEKRRQLVNNLRLKLYRIYPVKNRRIAELRNRQRGVESGGLSYEREVADWLTPHVRISLGPFDIDLEHEFPFLAPPRQHPKRVLEFLRANYPEIFAKREEIIKKAEELGPRLHELKTRKEPAKEAFELKAKVLWEPYQRLVAEIREAID